MKIHSNRWCQIWFSDGNGFPLIEVKIQKTGWDKKENWIQTGAVWFSYCFYDLNECEKWCKERGVNSFDIRIWKFNPSYTIQTTKLICKDCTWNDCQQRFKEMCSIEKVSLDCFYKENLDPLTLDLVFD